MPNTTEYQRFPIEAFEGGIRANVRKSAVPVGAFSDAFGWITKKKRAEFSAGWQHAAPTLLAEEWQDHWSGGVVSIATSRLSEIIGSGIPFSIVRLVELADGNTESLAQLSRLVKRWGEWEFKLDTDPQSAWTKIDPVLFGGHTFGLVELYPGRSFGPIGEISSEVVRCTIRRIDQAPASLASATLNKGWGTARQATSPLQHLAVFRPGTSTEHLVLATPREIYLYDGIARAVGRCLNPVTELDGGFTLAPSGSVAPQVGSSEFVTGFPHPRAYLDVIGLDCSDDRVEVIGVNVTGGVFSAFTRRELEYDLADYSAGVTKALLRHGFGVANLREAARRRWESAVWSDGLPENLLLMTNGVDPVQKWNGGSGNLEPLANMTIAAEGGVSIDAARIVRVFFESVLLFDTTEDAARHPRRIRWSRPRDCEAWEAFKWRDLPTADAIVQAVVYGKMAVVLCERSIHNITPVGSPYDFKVDTRTRQVGCIAEGSVCVVPLDAGGEGVLFLGPDDFYAYDGTNPTRIGSPIKDMALETLSDDLRPFVASEFWPDLGLYLCSVPTTSKRGPGTHLGDLRNAMTFAFDVQERAWQKPIEGFMGFGRYYQQTNLPINSYTGPIHAYRDVYDRRGTVGRPELMAGTWDGRVTRALTGSNAGGVDQEVWFETGFSTLGFDGMKTVGWVVPEGDGAAEIELWVRTSLDGNRGQLEFCEAFRMSDSMVAGDERIVSVDRWGKFFSFRFVVRGRNARATIDSLSVYFRPLGRD